MTGFTESTGDQTRMVVLEVEDEMTPEEIVLILYYLRSQGFAARLSPYLPNGIIIEFPQE
jgi:hypothetical protein